MGDAAVLMLMSSTGMGWAAQGGEEMWTRGPGTEGWFHDEAW